MSRQQYKSIATVALESRKLDSCTVESGYLYLRLILATDGYGCIEYTPRRITSACFPSDESWTDKRSEKCVVELAEIGLIEVYEKGGSAWLQITNYDEHQSSHFKSRRGDRKTPEREDETLLFAGTNTEGIRKVYGSYTEGGTDRVVKSSVVKSRTMSSSTEHDVWTIFNYWKRATGRTEKVKLDSARQTKIKARLNEGRTVEDICKAIDYYAASPYHQGENPMRKRYDDITTICRDAGQIEKALDTRTQQPAAQSIDYGKYLRD